MEWIFYYRAEGEVHKLQQKERDQYFPNTDRTSWFNEGFIFMFLYKFENSKRIPITKRALQGRKKRTNDFLNVIFAKVFAKIIGKKARTRFRLHTKLSSLLEFFQNTI